MSTRALRRLKKERGIDADELEQVPYEEESGDETKASLFAVLAANLSSDDEGEESSLEDKPSNNVQNDLPKDDQETNTFQGQSHAISLAKKYKQPKKKSPKPTFYKANPSATAEEEEKEDSIIDELLEELNTSKLDESVDGVSQDENINLILRPNSNYLDPAIELRRKVGSSGAKSSELMSHSEIPDSLPKMVSSRIRNRHHRWRRQLITPRPMWPRVTGSLVEICLQHLRGHERYGTAASALVPSPSYEEQFEELKELIDVGNIDLIYAFARRHPLHVDGLLVMSDFLRMSSAPTEAIELTERAIYILEKALLKVDMGKAEEDGEATSSSSIDITKGTLRLPYEIFDNRRMHLALFRYIQFLIKRGCYRTALELGKLLWSLDPLEDPLGVRLFIDFLAIQTEQWQWFDQINSRIQAEYPWMANWRFSEALKCRLATPKHKGGADEDELDIANQLLQQAIIDYPWMIPRLAAAVGLQFDETGWRNFFPSANFPPHSHVPPFREAMAKIYAQRSGPLWKYSSQMNWLEINISMVLSRQSSSNVCGDGNDPSALESLSTFRHSVMSDLNNVQVSPPYYIHSGAIHMYNPLPPEDVLLDETDEAISRRNCSIQ